MSWECPHQYKDYCNRLEGPCKPTTRGCVLYNLQGDLLGIEEEDNMSNNTTTLNITADTTAAEVIIRYPWIRPLMEQLELDYCCGGQRPLHEAAEHAGVNLEQALKTLNSATPPANAQDERDWSTATNSELVDHINNTHHIFTRTQLQRIEQLMAKVLAAHGATHGDLLNPLNKLFIDLRDELTSHLQKEEQILFPAIKEIDAFLAGNGPRPVIHCGSVAYPIRQMVHEHDNAGDILAEMRKLTSGYTLPEGACATFGALYDALPELEDDLHQHIHLENNILFPAAIAQEASLSPCGSCTGCP